MKKPKRKNPQHTNTCGQCPFTCKSDPGGTGGSPPEVYIAQTLAPYRVPCHQFIDYDDPEWKGNNYTPQCVGHSIMRHNEGVIDRMPAPLLKVEPYEGSKVFDNLITMYAYHYQISLEEAAEFLTPDNVTRIVRRELSRRGAKVYRPGELPK